MINISNIVLLFGIEVKTKLNRFVMVRKRIMHRGYQINEISYKYNEIILTELANFKTKPEVQEYLDTH